MLQIPQKTQLTSPFGSMSPVQLLVLQALLRKKTPVYQNIGRQIPGVARRVKGYEWVQTGQEKIVHLHAARRKVVVKHVVTKLGTHVDTRLTKAQRMARRVARGLPAHA